ncbi:MAG TPA: DEAD/DEAH box helicase [Candidatus Ligilactobacillus excrementigallinarum]|uniref:DEAD/DEAH box helicase n=1 Tax=Candidatus Ligilactobacillus excrementigallinarum TaxID=2838641 RepID=A0A9D1UX95_9LACO|nr:DEAD/DEAH box helicase [Candidatus Ligilactobacillus excrementigallinarum]
MNEKFKQHFDEQGFEKLTPIQEATFEALANDENVLGVAPTGSGKTLAYALPLLEKLVADDGTQLLILAPSQELAAQITNVVHEWASLIELRTISLIGGANIKRQIEKLKKHPEIVVGTPGRVLELVEQRKLKLHHLMTAVIDEADEMLQEQESMTTIRKILSHAPAEIQMVFFSATKAPVFNEFHRWFGIEPKYIDVSDRDDTAGQVTHYLLETPTRKRVDMLRRIAHLNEMHALVFFKQVSTLEEVYQKLQHHHIAVAKLSSNGRQTERQQALAGLKKGTLTFVLTTDVAARGIDIPNLPAVINFDIPQNQTIYIHRAGRTGRMGAPGAVINLGNEHELRNFKKLMNKTTYDIQNGFLYNGQIFTENPHQACTVHKNRPVNKPIEGEKKKRKKNRKRNRKNKGKPKAHKNKQ